LCACCFFFQAEDGIRDGHVTGVQTCALPIWMPCPRQAASTSTDSDEVLAACRGHGIPAVLTSPDHPSGTDRVWEVAQARRADLRSEERRVGKEGGARRATDAGRGSR